MLAAYKKNVILAYHKKKDIGKLSPNLISPSPGQLRDECLIVYHERYDPKDDEILRLFFSSKNNDSVYSKSIENFNINELRPLVYLLKGKVKEPGDKIISLLAWLIDFKPRPYTFGETGDGWEDSKDETDKGEKGTGTVVIDNPEVIINKSPWKKLTEFFSRRVPRSAALATILVLFTSSGTYFWWTANNQQCMYWSTDHYKATACDDKVDAIVVALDAEKVEKLKKITQQDTITYASIGKVGWAKVNGRVEFYTSTGDHPTEPNKRLLPITKYMIDKYILPLKQ